MGKDRNKPLFIRLARRDHYDDQDVSITTTLAFYSNDLSAADTHTHYFIDIDLQVQPAFILPKRPLSKHKG